MLDNKNYELIKDSVCANFALTIEDVKVYNPDMILSML
jgi:hypothetical protein